MQVFMKKGMMAWGLVFALLWLLQGCSSSPEFKPNAKNRNLQQDIRQMKSQWADERCPSNATSAQCSELLQNGLRHCTGKNQGRKTKCIYYELYCTLFGGDACRF